MRIVVVGTSGSGKTTFARALAAKLDLPHVELDALHWLPGWTGRKPDDFRKRVAEATAGAGWVVDGNYSIARDVVWPKATDVVWLNFSRTVVFSRVFVRTLRRTLTREPLWSGNVESLRKAFLSRDSILRWTYTTYGRNRVRYAALRQTDSLRHLRWHELKTARDATRFLARAGSDP